ncbi:unnamed protein product, partial [Urochloa humidicola]
ELELVGVWGRGFPDFPLFCRRHKSLCSHRRRRANQASSTPLKPPPVEERGVEIRPNRFLPAGLKNEEGTTSSDAMDFICDTEW